MLQNYKRVSIKFDNQEECERYAFETYRNVEDCVLVYAENQTCMITGRCTCVGTFLIKKRAILRSCKGLETFCEDTWR